MPIAPLSAFLRPTLLAASLVMLLGTATDADAQRRRAAAPKPPPGPTACTDFYSFHNKDWLAATPVPAQGMVTALGELQQRSLQQQRELLDTAMRQPANPVQQLLGDFWASGLDEAAVEADGAQPIAPLLARIDAIRRARHIPPAIAALHQVGIPVAFNFNADVDLGDLGRHIGYFTQGGLGLPDPAFYTRGDANSQALLGRYREYVRNILVLSGVPEAQADAAAGQVIELETRIAQKSPSLVDSRDPRANYARVAVRDASRQYRNLQLGEFLTAQGVEDDVVSLAPPALFADLNTFVAGLPVDQWKHYLRFHVGSAMAPYLSKPWRDADFAFRGRLLRGDTAPATREVLTLEAINKAAGPMLAREYVARHLPAATRERADTIATQVRDALVRSIERSTWMTPATKAEARAKASTIRIEIGAPVEDLDFSVQPMGRGSFGGNMLIASTWQRREEMKRIGRANADRRWDVLPQQPALAYDLAQNRLIVSAAVLQPPVLDLARTPESHYGSYGALVGHELGRSVDIRGRVVDARQDARMWWSPEDLSAWEGIASRLAVQYSAYPYPGLTALNVDGTRTRDENAADLAGVELALDAFTTANPGATPEASQQFFAAWAELWRQQAAPAAAQHAAMTSPHAPGHWRTNGPLANLPAFGTAFACDPGAPMQRTEAEQIRIWR
ncbi:M13-type metalloendopeptidase [Luteimonas sp. MHLX1A]|uniref:M13-type metalloendopeptidase n=1 Tax=Alterluteimonas muca TaxID=2878684 RepID=UPI001E3567D2|nr:M13 family metallopeptidase [Luteimonas sp. MHLX1A]MCD9046141.1 M13 family metallopeptidase [Luteimonas sp. MHLX1A]